MENGEAFERRRNTASKATANLVLRTPKPKERKELSKPPNEKKRDVDPGIVPSQAAAISLVNMSYVLALVFGGCCTNVWAYEHLLNIDPRIGTALTFSQMLFITFTSLPAHLTSKRFFGVPLPVLKERQVPLYHWFLQVLVHTSGSLLNNMAFAYHIPITIQIVFRSAGWGVSMLFGFAFLRKRYSFPQIASVVLVSGGVILATLSRPAPLLNDSEPTSVEDYVMGVTMLTISLFLTGILGLLQERTYAKFGPCWREGVFYTHSLSLPIFALMTTPIKYGFLSLARATYTPTPTSHLPPPTWLTPFGDVLKYTPYFMLAGNLLSQLICVSGVNQLTSRASSVSANLVLTTRKALSLCFSVWYFGNGWNTELGIGASMVFLGSLIYTLISSSSPALRPAEKVKPKKEIKAE